MILENGKQQSGRKCIQTSILSILKIKFIFRQQKKTTLFSERSFKATFNECLIISIKITQYKIKSKKINYFIQSIAQKINYKHIIFILILQGLTAYNLADSLLALFLERKDYLDMVELFVDVKLHIPIGYFVVQDFQSLMDYRCCLLGYYTDYFDMKYSHTVDYFHILDYMYFEEWENILKVDKDIDFHKVNHNLLGEDNFQELDSQLVKMVLKFRQLHYNNDVVFQKKISKIEQNHLKKDLLISFFFLTIFLVTIFMILSYYHISFDKTGIDIILIRLLNPFDLQKIQITLQNHIAVLTLYLKEHHTPSLFIQILLNFLCQHLDDTIQLTQNKIA